MLSLMGVWPGATNLLSVFDDLPIRVFPYDLAILELPVVAAANADVSTIA